MKNNDALYFGVTRFSVYSPKSSGWNLSSQYSERDYIDNLYSDERLSARFDIFINYSLPIYASYAEKYSYRHIVIYSEEMPYVWKEKLYKAASKFPFVCLCKSEEGIYDISGFMKKLVQEQAKSSCLVLQFRVDDDDVLSSEYIDELSKYASKSFVGMSVSFGSGIAAKYRENVFTNFRSVRKHFLALGLATVGEYDKHKEELWFPDSLNKNHIETDLYRPVIVDSRKPVYIWTHHDFQDTDAKSPKDSVNSRLLSYKPLSDNSSCIHSFPTLSNDYAKYRSDAVIVYSLGSSVASEDGMVKFSAVDMSSPGLYKIDYSFYLSSPLRMNSRGLVLCLAKSEEVSVEGMSLSKRKDIGWFKYVSVGSERVFGECEFYLRSGVGDDGVLYLKRWGYQGEFLVDQFSVRYLGR